MSLYRKLVVSALGSIADNLNDMAKSGQSSYCPTCTVDALQPWVDGSYAIMNNSGLGAEPAFNALDNLLDGCKPNIALALRAAIQDHLEVGHCDEDVLESYFHDPETAPEYTWDEEAGYFVPNK